MRKSANNVGGSAFLMGSLERAAPAGADFGVAPCALDAGVVGSSLGDIPARTLRGVVVCSVDVGSSSLLEVGEPMICCLCGDGDVQAAS
jgi:hypothetical protein